MVRSSVLKIWHVIAYRRYSSLVHFHYELLDAFIPLNMPTVKELCCCCWICCCCCCCWLFAWRPCFGTGGCRYSCLASVSTSIRSSFLYARQLLMKLCNTQFNPNKILISTARKTIHLFWVLFVQFLPLLRC